VAHLRDHVLVAGGGVEDRRAGHEGIGTGGGDRADVVSFDAAVDLEDAVRRLRTIRGVGEWTAQYIALRQLREPDAFPHADIGLIRALEKLESRPYTPAQLLARSEAWRPWRAYAAQHLWTA